MAVKLVGPTANIIYFQASNLYTTQKNQTIETTEPTLLLDAPNHPNQSYKVLEQSQKTQAKSYENIRKLFLHFPLHWFIGL